MLKLIKSHIFITCSLISFVFVSCSALPRNWTRKTHFDSQDLMSENPVHQIQAIRTVADNHDKAQVPVLLKLMMVGEPSVREDAYWGTRELTGIEKPPGNSPDYQSYGSVEERQLAVDSWKKYWDNQLLQDRPSKLQANPIHEK